MNTKKQLTQQRIIESAGKGIRQHGYGGIGVDGIAKAAGVTSGAIYGNFGSKDKVFEATVESGMRELAQGVIHWRETQGELWLSPFVEWYLSLQRRKDTAGGCALPGLTADVARAGKNVHKAYEEQLNKVVAVVADGLTHDDPQVRSERAWAILAALTGAVMISRACHSSELATEIADSTKATIDSILNS